MDKPAASFFPIWFLKSLWMQPSVGWYFLFWSKIWHAFIPHYLSNCSFNFFEENIVLGSFSLLVTLCVCVFFLFQETKWNFFQRNNTTNKALKPGKSWRTTNVTKKNTTKFCSSWFMSLNEGFCKQMNPAKGKMLLHVTQMKNLVDPFYNRILQTSSVYACLVLCLVCCCELHMAEELTWINGK